MEPGDHPSDRLARPRDVVSDLEVLDGLLSTLTDVLDIRDVFDRVSQLVQRVLPHDVLGVMEISEKGDRIRLLASAGLPGAQTFEAPILGPDFLTKPWNITIIDDVPHNTLFCRGPAAKAGMQSVLSVPISFGGRLRTAVNFFSREKVHFSEADFPVAQRIASYITFAMSHHRLAEEARLAAEANARADRLESRVQQLTDELDARGGYRRVIGESVPWREVLKKATQVATTEVTVLLLGESGTGKEVIARFVHRGSARRDGPFVALNCAALPEHLLEGNSSGSKLVPLLGR